ncbi:MAG: RNase P modulator RnpM [Bacillota bacterium]|jgi:predicted RNA-binding protein YlxR (DUF448 family)
MRTRKVPMRMCVGCKEMRPKRELLRVVRTPDGEVLLDSTGKKSGRGAYICPDSGCLELALKGDRLSKALEVNLDAEMAERLRQSVRPGSE